MVELNQQMAEALVWAYFRVILPVSREKLKACYKAASDIMKPGYRSSNTKGEFTEMRDFYHDLLAANPEWAFTAERPVIQKRPNRGTSRRMKVLAAGVAA